MAEGDRCERELEGGGEGMREEKKMIRRGGDGENHGKNEKKRER